MNFCARCGGALVAGDRFCQHCGAPVQAPSATTVPEGSPPTAVIPPAPAPGLPAPGPRPSRGSHLRIVALVAALVVAIGAAGAVGGYLLLREDGPVSVTAEGGFEVRGPRAAFPDGDPEVALVEQDADFLDAFGLDEQGRVLSVTAEAQPREPVEVVLPYDPAAVPEGGTPAVFYFDEEADLWLPIETVADPDAGVLIGTTDHFTNFAAGLLEGLLDVTETVVHGVASGVDWLGYQVAGVTGARADELSCGQSPGWVTGAETTHDAGFRLSAALFACPEEVPGDPDRLRLRLAVNRAYGFELTAEPAAASIEVEPSPELSGALGRSFGELFRAENGTVIAPGTATVVMEFDRPAADVRQIVVDGHMTAQSTLVDAVMLALDVGSIFASGGVTEKVEAFGCAVALIKGAGDIESQTLFLGTWSKVVRDCFGPATAELGEELLGRVGAGISVGLSMGQVGQSFLDRERDLLNGVRVQVGVLPPGSLDGRWEGGPVPQPGAPPYGVVVDLTESGGQLSAAVLYPELGCSGTWTGDLLPGSSGRLVEIIDDDPAGRCVRQVDVAVTLVGADRLLVRYRDSYEVLLSRTGAPGSGGSAVGAGTVPAPPATAVYLSDVRIASGGVGSSGERISSSATISGRRAQNATGQWVGCRGTTAWSEYAMEGATRLTGWLGYREFAEPGVLTELRVYVDGRQVTSLQVDLGGTDVDLDLPPGQVLRLEASHVGGPCGSHSEGYLAWGNGALS